MHDVHVHVYMHDVHVHVYMHDVHVHVCMHDVHVHVVPLHCLVSLTECTLTYMWC